MFWDSASRTPSIHWTATGTSVHTQLKDRESAKTSTSMSSAIIIEATVALSDKIIVIQRVACTTWRLQFRLNGKLKLNYDLTVSAWYKSRESFLFKIDTEFMLVNVFFFCCQKLFQNCFFIQCFVALVYCYCHCWSICVSMKAQKKLNHGKLFFLYIKASSSHYPQNYIICSANEQSDGRTRIGRQQNGDTYTLEISFPAVKYVLG